MVGGRFIDLRDENDIMDRYGEQVHNQLTKSMIGAMQAQVPVNDNPENEVNEMTQPSAPTIDPKIINWMKTNKITKGEYVPNLVNKNMIDLTYYPSSTLGISKRRKIASILKPSNVTKPNGQWIFDGTIIKFK